MGVKSFLSEIKLKVSPSRIFKATLVESSDVLPKAIPTHVKSSEVVGGGPAKPGCTIHITMANGGSVNMKIDTLDTENCVAKYTVAEGNVLGDKFEKIYHELHCEASSDGGCVMKFNSKYFAKGDAEPKDEDIKSDTESATAFFVALGDYLHANPHVCA